MVAVVEELMDELKIAAAIWPGHAVLICILILKNQRLEPIMETAIYGFLGLSFVVAAFVLLSRFFSEPPDMSHPE